MNVVRITFVLIILYAVLLNNHRSRYLAHPSRWLIIAFCWMAHVVASILRTLWPMLAQGDPRASVRESEVRDPLQWFWESPEPAALGLDRLEYEAAKLMGKWPNGYPLDAQLYQPERDKPEYIHRRSEGSTFSWRNKEGTFWKTAPGAYPPVCSIRVPNPGADDRYWLWMEVLPVAPDRKIDGLWKHGSDPRGTWRTDPGVSPSFPAYRIANKNTDHLYWTWGEVVSPPDGHD